MCEREREKEREREIEGERERERGREGGRETDRQTERKKEGECEKERETSSRVMDIPMRSKPIRTSSLYRGTSLIRNTPRVGPYNRTLPRVLWWS